MRSRLQSRCLGLAAVTTLSGLFGSACGTDAAFGLKLLRSPQSVAFGASEQVILQVLDIESRGVDDRNVDVFTRDGEALTLRRSKEDSPQEHHLAVVTGPGSFGGVEASGLVIFEVTSGTSTAASTVEVLVSLPNTTSDRSDDPVGLPAVTLTIERGAEDAP